MIHGMLPGRSRQTVRTSRCPVALMSLAVLVPGPAARTQQIADTMENAAPLLREAHRLLPEFTETEEALLDQSGTGDSSPAHRELMDRMEPSLSRFREAGDMPEAFWDLPFAEEGLSTLMPHLHEVRKLARMVHHHARAQLPAQPDAFVKDELAVLAAARHVGREGPLISLLVEYAVDSQALDQLARYLPGLSPEALDRLAAGVDRLSDGGTLASALRMEKAIGIDGIIKRIRSALQARGSDSEVIHSASTFLADEFRVCSIMRMGERSIRIGLEEKDGSNFVLSLGRRRRGVELVSVDFEREEAVLIKDGQAHVLALQSRTFIPLDFKVTRDELLKQLPEELVDELLADAGEGGGAVMELLEEAEEDFEEMIRALDLPPDDFEAWQDQFDADVERRNSLTRWLMPAIGRAYEIQARTQVRRHMLATAIRMVREDRSVLLPSDDSGGAMSLTSRRTATGFELVSPTTMNGEPVTLQVGERARPE